MKKHYEAVPVETQLPPKANDYYGVLAVGHSCPMMREWDGRKFNSPVQSEIVTHWLREVEVGSSVSSDAHTREVAEKAVDEALDVVFKDCIITDIATDCVEQSGKQFLKDKILARLNPEGK